MTVPPSRNPALPAFAIYLLGILAQDRGAALEWCLLATGVICLAVVVLRCRAPRPSGHVPAIVAGPVRWMLLLLVVFAAGAFRLDVSGRAEWAFGAMDGNAVMAVVQTGRMVRRDAGEVAAMATVLSVSGAPGESGRRVMIRCFVQDGEGPGTCAALKTGATVAVRGRAVTSGRGGSAILTGRSGIVPVRRESGRGGLSSGIDRLRAWLTFRAMREFDGEAAWLIPAIVLGEGRGVPAIQRMALSALGTSHLLSVSGLHVVAASAGCGLLVALLVGIPASLFRQRTNVPAIAAFTSIAAAWVVCLLAGAPSPAVRAAGMSTALAVSIFMRRRVPPESIVAVTGLANLVALPDDGLTISFQLSYAAVFGISLAADAWRRLRVARDAKPLAGVSDRLRKSIGWLEAGLLVSVGASLATMPLTVLYFDSAPLLGVIANLIVVPCFTFFVFPGAIAMLALMALLPPDAPWSGFPAILQHLYCSGVDAVMGSQVAVARWLPWQTVHPPFPLNAVAASAAAGLFAAMFPGRRSLRGAAGLVVAASVFLAGSWQPEPGPGVVFLDVGKGDAAVVRCPSGANWLIDTGPPPGRSDRLLSALTRVRAYSIEGIVITHAHDDHFGGLESAVAAFGALEVAASARTLAGIGPLADIVRDAGGSIRIVKSGDHLIPGCGIDTIVLSAAENCGPAGRNAACTENDSSLVFRLGGPRDGILFAGDLESPGELALVARHVDLSARVLKAGHHGSTGSSSREFISAIGPAEVVVSGWPSGPRSGPSDALLSRFVQSKSAVMATALIGDVDFQIGTSGDQKSESEPALKPRSGIPRGFRGTNDLVRSLIKVVKSSSDPQRN